jgi:transcriptional regulator of arginine metabolism
LTYRRRHEYYLGSVNTHSKISVLRRRDAILRVVREEAVRSQEELQRILAERGFEATQPTLSRDVRELGLVKTPRGYALPGAPDPAIDAARRAERLERALAEAVLSVRIAGSLVVLKTPPAGAHPVARVVDEAALPEAVGTIAGDDTVFVAARDAVSARALAARLAGPPPADRRRHA